MGREAARISEWENSGVRFKLHFQWLISAHNFKAKESRRLLTSGIPAISAEPRIDKAPLIYRGEKSAKPLRDNSKKPARVSPIYKEAEKGGNVRRKINFSLSRKVGFGLLHASLDSKERHPLFDSSLRFLESGVGVLEEKSPSISTNGQEVGKILQRKNARPT